MSATDRHINKIRLIRKSLERGNTQPSEIADDTGIHRITVRERLWEALSWGAVTVDKDDNWSLDK